MADQIKLPADITPAQVKSGMTIRLHQKIKEIDPSGKEKERVQVFEGIVLKVGGETVSKTMTVRKISNGVGVEKIYPLILPSIARIELMKVAKVARKNIGFVRHSKKRLKESLVVTL
ncbi:MAG: 50S ribosomal protein L19 [bacterium]|nr:50S ribosomal protein L19 [bacterium]